MLLLFNKGESLECAEVVDSNWGEIYLFVQRNLF